jgi:hypothetical protein
LPELSSLCISGYGFDVCDLESGSEAVAILVFNLQKVKKASFTC